MYSMQALGQSKESQAEALAAALSSAISSISGAARTHIVVRGIVWSSGEWKAIIDTIVEPILPEPKPDLKTTESEEADVQAKRKAVARRSLEEWAHNDEITHRIILKHEEEAQADLELTLLYIELAYEMAFREIEDRFHFDGVHYMTEGSLLEAARTKFPDMELYKAAHMPEKSFAPSPAFEKEFKPQKQYIFADELIDE